jgi:SAM-dependent methyltransferase
MILDLGCGTEKEVRAIGIDNVALPGVDVVHDLLDFPYPFTDGSAKQIYLKHVLEHFSMPDIRSILREVYRILEPGGIVHIRLPHAFSVAAWADPTHRMAFTFISAEFFAAGSAKAYYKETDNVWDLVETSARVTWFNWKRYRLRRLDAVLSRMAAGCLNWLLKQPGFPGSADLMVKAVPAFFVEIAWRFRKPVAQAS